jgi:hypothetical protein
MPLHQSAMVGRDAAPLIFNVVLARTIPRCPRAPGSALKAETPKRTPAWGFYFGIRGRTSQQFPRRSNGGFAVLRYIAGMCGRATYKLTWEEIVALYQLTLFQPAVNTRARFNVCPTTTIDTILDHDGKRRLERMRWGLIASWWSKPFKEMNIATFNARAETVATKPMFRSAFKRNRCLIPCRAITSGKTRRAVNSLGISLRGTALLL